MDRIRERKSAFFDELVGRNMLVFVDPATFTPSAIYVDAAGATIDGKEVHFDDGSVLRSGVLYDRDGVAQTLDRPQQLFTRRYGFALTFPDPEVFGE